MGKGNVPDLVEVTESDYSLLAIASCAVGPPTRTGSYALNAWLTKVATVAGQLRTPAENAAGYLAQLRASEQRPPIKGVVTAVQPIEVTRNERTGHPLRKVEVTYTPTTTSKWNPNNEPETIRSDWTFKVGFGDVATEWSNYIGQECLLYRYLEATTDDEGTGRVLVRVRPLAPRPTQTDQVPEADRGDTDQPDNTAPPTADALTPSGVVELAAHQLDLDQALVVAHAKAILGPSQRTTEACAFLWRALRYMARHGTVAFAIPADNPLLDHTPTSAKQVSDLAHRHLGLSPASVTQHANQLLPDTGHQGTQLTWLWRALVDLSFTNQPSTKSA